MAAISKGGGFAESSELIARRLAPHRGDVLLGGVVPGLKRQFPRDRRAVARVYAASPASRSPVSSCLVFLLDMALLRHKCIFSSGTITELRRRHPVVRNRCAFVDGFADGGMSGASFPASGGSSFSNLPRSTPSPRVSRGDRSLAARFRIPRRASCARRACARGSRSRLTASAS